MKNKRQNDGVFGLSKSREGNEDPFIVGFIVNGPNVEVQWYIGCELVTARDYSREAARKIWFDLRNQGFKIDEPVSVGSR